METQPAPDREISRGETLALADRQDLHMSKSAASTLGQFLKATREQRGFSQMELALEAGVSQRHIAFIEIGRAKPSRALLLRLLDKLECCTSSRNAALFHAGYLPEDLGRGPAADQLNQAVSEMIEAHYPFPAMVFDSNWHVHLASAGAWWLFSQVMPKLWSPDSLPLDIIAAIASPDGVLSKAKNPELLASGLLAQIQAEAWAIPALGRRLAHCESALEERFGPLPVSGGDSPALTVEFDCEIGELSFFSIQLIPGLPHNVSINSLRVELTFPADESTRRIMWREVTKANKLKLPMIDLPNQLKAELSA